MHTHSCPDCDHGLPLDRRHFLAATGAAVAAATAAPVLAAPTIKPGSAESYVKKLYESLTPEQKKVVCFDWDYVDPRRGLLRARVQNNWRITRPAVLSEFYTKDQQELIRAVFERIYSPEWIKKIDKQLRDDAGGWGRRHSIAIFGTPGEGNFEFVFTGRHITIRCDGNSAEHVAFGGPIFYGHAARGFNEAPDHPGNVFWPQALEANKVWQVLDGKQRRQALVAHSPRESAVAFRGKEGSYPGIPIAELTADQKQAVQKVLKKLLEPFRQVDRQEVVQCLEAQGGLDHCHLAFYKDHDIGNDQVWDNWRLEGPAFVWYYRGAPHVHVWVNVASSPKVKIVT